MHIALMSVARNIISENGRLSLQGVLTRVLVSGFPSILHSSDIEAKLYTVWSNVDQAVDSTLVVMEGHHHEVLRTQTRIPSGESDVVQVSTLQNIKIGSPSDLLFVQIVEGKVLAYCRLLITNTSRLPAGTYA